MIDFLNLNFTFAADVDESTIPCETSAIFGLLPKP